MIPALPLFHNVKGRVVLVLGTGEPAMARRRLVERAGGIVTENERQALKSGARLAFVAGSASPEEDSARLRAAGMLVNVTDRPDLCDFTVPSLLNRSPVLVAVGTGGASAGLAKAVRLRLETLLPQSLGRLASALFSVRDAMRARWPDSKARRMALDLALADGGLLDPLREGSADHVGTWLAGNIKHTGAQVHVIALRSMDPDDLTLKEARLLGMADVIMHGPDLAPALLGHARADAARLPVGNDIPDDGLVVIIRADQE